MRYVRPFGLVAALVLLVAAAGVPLAGADTASPSLVVSVASAELVEIGHAAHLDITVENSGESTVTAIQVQDSQTGLVGVIAQLAPNESQTLSTEFILEGPVSGSCTATGIGPAGESVSASDDYFIEAMSGCLWTDMSVSKRALTEHMVPGGVVRYRITIANADGEPLDMDAPSIRVSDDFDESKASVLDAGGGVISEGGLHWEVDPPSPGEPPVVIEYSLAVDDDAAGALLNEVAIFYPIDPNPVNDQDSVTLLADVAAQPVATTSPTNGSSSQGSASATSEEASGEDPFLPFTGSDDTARTSWAALFAALGLVLHVWSRRSEVV